MLFNSTTNIKPTQFAEWTWQRFIQNESLAEKTFPEFCRPAQQSRAVLDKLFVFEPHEPLPADDSLRIVETSGRYKEVETIGREIADLLERGETPNQIVIVVRHEDCEYCDGWSSEARAWARCSPTGKNAHATTGGRVVSSMVNLAGVGLVHRHDVPIPLAGAVPMRGFAM